MSDLYRKLNLGDHRTVHLLDAPDPIAPLFATPPGVELKRALHGRTEFALAFATTRKELDGISRRLVEAAGEDAVLWIAYPKGSSKRYKCEFNRDDGWNVLGEAGYEPVRMVAIDEDWSALRFRKAGSIGKMTRSRAISETGKARIGTASTGKPATASKPDLPGRTAFATHEEYIASRPEGVRPLLEWIRTTTESVVPEASPCVSYGMPAFRKRKIFLYFAAFKEHIGIYPPLRADVALIRELEPFRGPKGNLSFPLSRPFPKALVRRVVKALAAEHGGDRK